MIFDMMVEAINYPSEGLGNKDESVASINQKYKRSAPPIWDFDSWNIITEESKG